MNKYELNFRLSFLLLLVVPFYSFGANSNYGFIENKGQILTQNRNVNTKVLYYLSEKKMNFHLNKDGFSYELVRFSETPLKKGKNQVDPRENRPSSGEFIPISFNRVDLEFIGCNSEAAFITSELQSSILNFYNEHTPSTGYEGIRHYNSITRKNIYPNIDVVFSCSDGFKYTFIVHPGGNINDIRIRVNGAIKNTISEAGHLQIYCNLGLIKEHIPLSYLSTEKVFQEPILVQYKQFTENEFGFTTNENIKNKTLVIDPSPWATYFGGTAYENGSTVKTDTSGSSIVVGYSYSAFGIASSGAFQSTYAGNNDGIILKFSEFGDLLWATYYGGNDNDYCYDVSISKQGYLLIGGLTGSPNGIASTNAFQDTLNGITDAFVLKFTGAGTRVWGTYFGGNFLDYGYGVTGDLNEDIYLSGYTNSDQKIATLGSHQTSLGGNNDGMIAKFNSNGDLIWATYYGGTYNDYNNGITCDPYGNLLFTGFTSSPSSIASSNSHQSQLANSTSNTDAYLVKFSPSGTRIWGTYFGGSSNEDGRNLTCDEKGTIYLIGTTYSNNGIASSGTFQTVNKGENEVFLASFDSSGTKKWGTYFGGDVNDYGSNVVIDKFGNLVIVGFTNSSTGIASPDALQTTYNGNEDAFIAKFDTTGNRIWSTYYGGTSGDYAYGIAIGKNNYILVTGLTGSISNISTPFAWQTSLAGSNDLFLLSLTGNGNLIPITKNAIFGSQISCGSNAPIGVTGIIPSGGSGIYTYTWLISYTDSSSGFYPAPGTNNLVNYSVSNINTPFWLRRIVVSGGDIDTSNALTLKLFPKPNATFIINNPSQCVNTNEFQLSDQSNVSDSIVRYYWAFGDGNFDSLNQNFVSKSYSISGSYLIKLVKQNYWGCKDSVQKTVVVNPKPIAITNTSQFTTFCEGPSISLHTNLFTGIKGQWIKNSLPLVDTLSDLIVPNSGIYQCIQTNVFGCSDTSNSITVTVNPKPIGQIDGPDSVSFCADKSALLVAQQKSLSYYQWYKNESKLFGSNQNSLECQLPGIYKLVVRNEFGCYDTSKQVFVNQNPKPSLSVISGLNSIIRMIPTTLDPQVYKVTPKIGSKFNWYLNNLPLSINGPDSVEVTWVQNGTYTLKLVENNSFSCQSDTAYLSVTVFFYSGLNTIGNNDFSIFPNPNNGEFTIQLTKPFVGEWHVLNVFGQIVETLSIKGNEANIDLSHLANGTYFLRYESNDKAYWGARKIILLK